MHGENLLFARDLVRRGLDQTALDSYRVAQSIAWRRWTRICFDLTSDPSDLRELLDVMLQSISTYIDDLVVVFAEQIELAREELSRSTHAQRSEIVSLLLEGAPMLVRAPSPSWVTRSPARSWQRSCGPAPGKIRVISNGRRTY
jgi:DNA-binding PucR family transcriptional regulator